MSEWGAELQRLAFESTDVRGSRLLQNGISFKPGVLWGTSQTARIGRPSVLGPAPGGLPWDELSWRVTGSRDLEDRLKPSAGVSGSSGGSALLSPPGPSTSGEPTPPLHGGGGQGPREGAVTVRPRTSGDRGGGELSHLIAYPPTSHQPSVGELTRRGGSDWRATVSRCQSREESGWGERIGEGMGAQVRSREPCRRKYSRQWEASANVLGWDRIMSRLGNLKCWFSEWLGDELGRMLNAHICLRGNGETLKSGEQESGMPRPDVAVGKHQLREEQCPHRGSGHTMLVRLLVAIQRLAGTRMALTHCLRRPGAPSPGRVRGTEPCWGSDVDIGEWGPRASLG